MQPVSWYRLLALGVLAAPIAARAQGPQPSIRAIATIPGVWVSGMRPMPNGRTIIYATNGSLYAYDLETKRTTFITQGFDGDFAISPAGDRLAYSYYNAQLPDGDRIWSIPIDPKTGAPTAPAQRVTVGYGDTPSFSPDGTLLAYSAYMADGMPGVGIGLIAPTGGAARLLSPVRGIPWWSADGKAIYAFTHDSSGRGFIERVSVAGGKSEKVLSFPGGVDTWVDGQLALYRRDAGASADGRMGYVTAAGVRGEFKIPPESFTYGSELLATRTRPISARLLSLGGGSVRDALAASPLSREPVWSPDGTRFAVQDSIGQGFGITVVSSDGSHSRRYPIAGTLGFMSWSPDGKLIGYYSGPAATAISLLDLAAGTTRTISSAPDGSDWFVWRPDSRSILVLKHSRTAAGMESVTRTVYEAKLDGSERQLQELGSGFRFTRPISDRVMLGASSAGKNWYALVPLDGRPRRRLPDGTGGSRPWSFPGVSPDGRWLLWVNKATNSSLELMTSEGESSRVLNLPFQIEKWFQEPFFRPDGRDAVVIGRTAGETTSKVMLVPLDGSTPRALATFPTDTVMGKMFLSPDGNTLGYTRAGAPTSTIYRIDLSPLLKTEHKP